MAKMRNDINTTTCRVVYYEDELNDEFSDAVIEPRTIDESYDYDGGFLRFLGRIFWYYMLVRPFAAVFLKLKYHHKIVGKEKLKLVKGTGFFLYGNHTNPVADAFIPSMICKPTGAYEIVHPANVSMPVLGRINPSLGAIPLPDTKGALKGFTKAIDRAIKRKACVAIYPEAHIWPYCTWIRNFREASFRYPVRADKPVFCFTNTYHPGKGKTPRMITYVEGPFFADKSLPSKDQKKDLRDRVYAAMCEDAKKNTATLVKYIKKNGDNTGGEKNMRNLLFSGNDYVFDGIMTCLLSIFKRTKSEDPFTAYVLTMDVSHLKPAYVPIADDKIAYLDKVAKGYNAENRIVKIDVTDIYMKEFAACPNEQCYCSPYTLLRLFIDMIPDIPDKILYLDADIMFNREIELLYDIDITGYEYAAARDHYGKYLVHPNSINAGVLLFNMTECRRTGLFEKARNLIKTKKLIFADQSAIFRSTTRKKMLPQRFNDQKFLHKHTVVRHFSKRLFWLPYPHTDNIKQWHVDKVRKVFHYTQFDDVLNEYIDLRRKYEIKK